MENSTELVVTNEELWEIKQEQDEVIFIKQDET